MGWTGRVGKSLEAMFANVGVAVDRAGCRAGSEDPPLLADEDAVMAALQDGRGTLVETGLYHELDKILAESKPALLVLADVFGGNEIVRQQVPPHEARKEKPRLLPGLRSWERTKRLPKAIIMLALAAVPQNS